MWEVVKRYFRNLWLAFVGRRYDPQQINPDLDAFREVLQELFPAVSQIMTTKARFKPALNMTGWRAWVADGREFNSRDNTITDIPKRGMQAVMVERSDGTQVFLRGAKFYIWKHNTVVATMLPVTDAQNVFEGTKMPDKAFKALMQRTM